MVRTLSRGAANRSHLLRGELPPVMFLIDAFLRHNIFPCSIGPKEGEFSWKPFTRCQKDSSLGLIILSWQPFSTLRRRFTRRSFKEQIAFPSSSQGCYAKFWSIWDTPLSLSWRESEYAVSHSLLINGII